MFTPTLMRPAGLIHERRSEGAEQTRPILNPGSFWLPSTPEQAGKETYGVSTFGPAAIARAEGIDVPSVGDVCYPWG